MLYAKKFGLHKHAVINFSNEKLRFTVNGGAL